MEVTASLLAAQSQLIPNLVFLPLLLLTHHATARTV